MPHFPARMVSAASFYAAVLVLPFSLPLTIQAAVFSLPEPTVSPSPDSATQIPIPAGEHVEDLDVSPSGAEAAVLIEGRDGRGSIRIWDLQRALPPPIWQARKGLDVKSVAWHPIQRAFFLLGRRGKTAVIEKVAFEGGAWNSRTIFESRETLRRLTVGPRPFITGGETNEYRLFFGQKDSSGSYSIRSITERGDKPYQVIGESEEKIPGLEAYESPSGLIAPNALPIGFHPAGHLLFWENGNSCFEVAEYGTSTWVASSPVLKGKLCGGTVTATPNGLALLHWLPGKAGLESVMSNGTRLTQQCAGLTFAFTPSSVPDGKGVVGVLRNGAGDRLAYAPIRIPMADVTNAWMFVESEDDLARITATGSLLRNTGFEQMYNLYDTEKYNCGGFDHSTPTRPYLVTTDGFWEVFAAAFEGLFVVTEKQAAIPAFWSVVEEAARHFDKTDRGSYWHKVFAAVRDLKSGNPLRDEEVTRIAAAHGSFRSTLSGRVVDYGILKPRGNYAANPDFQMYFKAFTYLVRVASENEKALPELDRVPSALKQKIIEWVSPYGNFISASRSPLAWSLDSFRKPAYVKHRDGNAKIFPLSWAMDNEILNSTVYHDSWPEADRIAGPDGAMRLMATTLDMPAALGNPLALSVVRNEFNTYPKLREVMRDLKQRAWPRDGDGANLYDLWMNALNVQWAASPKLPSNEADWKAWDAKRLQTGLASWATLRHATVLVNETSGAECGEGGYEEIVLRPPRGYVEPDPETFAAIAGLFEAAAVKLLAMPMEGARIPNYDSGGTQALREGLLNRFKESAQAARLFASMARKELRGQALADSEYEAILDFGKVAEHHFLVYKSLSTQGLGLANPEPMAKIADVAHGPGGKPFLYAAVGRPMEWNQVVPFFGRREMVKGAVYSYYEFTSDTLFNDKEWQARLTRQARPAWIRSQATLGQLSCPPRKPF